MCALPGVFLAKTENVDCTGICIHLQSVNHLYSTEKLDLVRKSIQPENPNLPRGTFNASNVREFKYHNLAELV